MRVDCVKGLHKKRVLEGQSEEEERSRRGQETQDGNQIDVLIDF